jgi:hypothetical protein
MRHPAQRVSPPFTDSCEASNPVALTRFWCMRIVGNCAEKWCFMGNFPDSGHL